MRDLVLCVHVVVKTLKSLSPSFFSILDEKLSHPWIQIKKKKQLNFLRLSMNFDRADRGLVPMTFFLFKFVYYPTGFV